MLKIVRGRPRLFAGAVIGLAAWPLLPATLHPVTHAVLVWDIGVFAFLALSAQLFLTERLAHMEHDAAAQQEGEWSVFGLTLVGTVMSFAAIISEFGNLKDAQGASRSLDIALVVVTLLLSWLMTHVTFAFRYAHEFYSRDAGATAIDGGLEFPGTDRPDYLDFVYFALVLGMTFQVSDVQITARKLRRLATLHGLLGFLFNTVILALTVNLAAGLL